MFQKPEWLIYDHSSMAALSIVNRTMNSRWETALIRPFKNEKNTRQRRESTLAAQAAAQAAAEAAEAADGWHLCHTKSSWNVP